MNSIILSARFLITIGFFLLTSGLSHAAPDAMEKVKVPIGLQLYSLRLQFSKDIARTLDRVRDYEVKYVELAGTYGMTPERFRSELEERGLEAVSAHFPFERFRDNPEAIVREAKILGVKYVGCAWIPHQGEFNEQNARDAAETFNKAGALMTKEGLKFFYHTHGFEFRAHGDGTLFDLMMKETNPKTVNYEMDVFWVVHGGADPVALLKKYGKRWHLMHLKGMKEGTETGVFTGKSDVSNDVPVGSGKIDYAPVLRAAKKAKVKWYFIEDESAVSETQIAESLRYLKTVKW